MSHLHVNMSVGFICSRNTPLAIIVQVKSSSWFYDQNMLESLRVAQMLSIFNGNKESDAVIIPFGSGIFTCLFTG